MTDKLTIPVYESPETISIETVLEHYCKKAKSDIRRYGVEKLWSVGTWCATICRP